jgi:hypothetical protein
MIFDDHVIGQQCAVAASRHALLALGSVTVVALMATAMVNNRSDGGMLFRPTSMYLMSLMIISSRSIFSN